MRWEHCLSGAILNSDLDVCRRNGIWIGKAHGGLTIADNWIALQHPGAGTVVGIYAETAATSNNQILVDIHGNHIIAYTEVANLLGLVIGPNNLNIHFHDNAISYGGIYITGGIALRINNNRVIGSTTIVGVQGLHLEGNTFSAAVAIGDNTFAHYGQNHGTLTRGVGVVALPAGATEATVTWATLGIGSPPVSSGGGYRVKLFAATMGALNRREVWTNYSGTGITVYVETASGSADNVRIEWEIF